MQGPEACAQCPTLVFHMLHVPRDWEKLPGRGCCRHRPNVIKRRNLVMASNRPGSCGQRLFISANWRELLPATGSQGLPPHPCSPDPAALLRDFGGDEVPSSRLSQSTRSQGPRQAWPPASAFSSVRCRDLACFLGGEKGRPQAASGSQLLPPSGLWVLKSEGRREAGQGGGGNSGSGERTQAVGRELRQRGGNPDRGEEKQ